MPAEEGPSLARTRTAPRSMMSRLRDDSQRTAAESTRAPRLALEQQQKLEPKTLEQQLKDNEACGYERGAAASSSRRALSKTTRSAASLPARQAKARRSRERIDSDARRQRLVEQLLSDANHICIWERSSAVERARQAGDRQEAQRGRNGNWK